MHQAQQVRLSRPTCDICRRRIHRLTDSSVLVIWRRKYAALVHDACVPEEDAAAGYWIELAKLAQYDRRQPLDFESGYRGVRRHLARERPQTWTACPHFDGVLWRGHLAARLLYLRARNLSPRRRAMILERDNFRCRRCGADASDTRLVVDHIVPVVLGGGRDDSNLQTLCESCNIGKADRLPHPYDLRAE